MIRLTCTNCNTTLTIDEAFAGGVCRCQHCGTIQTVPTGAELSSAQAVGGKKLFERKVRADGAQGSGLDDLADVVASSGLSGSGLTSRIGGNKSKSYTLPAKNNAMLPMLVTAGIIIVILLVAVIFLWSRSSGTDNSASPVSGGAPSMPTASRELPPPPNPTAANGPSGPDRPAAQTPPPPAKHYPNFMGTRISQKAVVYLLDSSSAGQATFDPMMQACYRSLESLEPGQKFQIISWHGTVDFAYPKNGLISASPTNINAAKKQLEDVYTASPTEVGPSLKKALASHPEAILLATGKALTPEFANMVMTEVGDRNVVIHCFALGQDDSSGALRKIAQQTHGQYRAVTSEDLSLFEQGGQ